MTLGFALLSVLLGCLGSLLASAIVLTFSVFRKKTLKWPLLACIVLCASMVVLGVLGHNIPLGYVGCVSAGAFVGLLFTIVVCGISGYELSTSSWHLMCKLILAGRRCFAEYGATSETIASLGNMLGYCNLWHGKDFGLKSPNPIAAGHITSLQKQLHQINPGTQHLFTYSAFRSAQQLDAAPSNTTGQYLSSSQYVELLRQSFLCDSLCDVTCFDTLSPSKWGDPDNRETPLAQLAWDEYFNLQKRAKGDAKRNIRIRRIMLMEIDSWKADNLAPAFKKAHDDASISLWLLPPSRILGDLKHLARDMVFFYAADGSSWIVWSNIDDNKLSAENGIGVNLDRIEPDLIAIRAGVVRGCSGTPEEYRMFFRAALQKTHLSTMPPERNPLCVGSVVEPNSPPTEFLNQTGLASC